MEENVTGRAWSSPHAAEKPGETKAEAREAFLSTEIGLATRFQGWPWQRKVSVECLRWAGKRKKGEEVESSLQKRALWRLFVRKKERERLGQRGGRMEWCCLLLRLVHILCGFILGLQLIPANPQFSPSSSPCHHLHLDKNKFSLCRKKWWKPTYW